MNLTLIPSSISGQVGEWSPGETDTAIVRVINGVMPLQECHAEDEVNAGAVMSNVLYGQVNGVLSAVYGAVVRAWPDLSVRSQFECLAADVKVERIEVLVLLLGNAEEGIFTAHYRTRSISVLLECT